MAWLNIYQTLKQAIEMFSVPVVFLQRADVQAFALEGADPGDGGGAAGDGGDAGDPVVDGGAAD